MARIAGVDLPKEKRVEIGLTYIYGIGLTSSQKILVTDNFRVEIKKGLSAVNGFLWNFLLLFILPRSRSSASAIRLSWLAIMFARFLMVLKCLKLRYHYTFPLLSSAHC